MCGIDSFLTFSDEELLDLISRSRNNRTGFRWVSAQVENRILEGIRTVGVILQDEIMEELPELEDEEETESSSPWGADDEVFFD